MISSVLAVVVGMALVSTITLARRPILGATPARAEGRSVSRVQHAPSSTVGVAHTEVQPAVAMCGSTAFVDYAPDARGKATPIAAVRSYRPGARNLRITVLEPGRAVVEEYRGTLKVGAYELFRLKRVGWLVERADTFEPCAAPK